MGRAGTGALARYNPATKAEDRKTRDANVTWWMPPPQMSGVEDFQSDDFSIGVGNLCFSIDRVAGGSSEGQVDMMGKGGPPPHYFARSSERHSRTDADKCTLMSKKPGRDYLIVLTHDSWHRSVAPTSPGNDRALYH